MQIRRVKSRVAFENQWVRLYDDETVTPDGSAGTYSWIEHANGVGGAIVVPQLPDGRVLLINIHRYPVDRPSWEFPRGATAEGETAEQSAVRELREETGLVAQSVTSLGRFSPDSGLIGNMHLIALAQLSADAEGALELQYDEAITDARFVAENQLRKMISDGDIFDGATLSAVARWMANRAS